MNRQIIEDEEIMFLSDNTPRQLENIMRQLDENTTYRMPEDIKEAFELGVKTTISILEQYLSKSVEDGYVVLYNPDVEYSEEMDIEDFIKWRTEVKHDEQANYDCN